MPMPGCLPSEPTFVSDMCGVFVALAGKQGATGTMADPLPSLTEGIAAAVASNRYVFACADTFDEQVTITSGVSIYGGREDCTKGWTLKADGATTVNGPVDKISMVIDTPGHITLENVDVKAPAGTMGSKSSIAVLVNQAEAEFKNCKFTSQDAFKGDDGAVTAPDSALNGTPGLPGKAVCAPGNHLGGAAAVKSCGGATSTGGKGGDGGAAGAMSGGNGADGTLTSPAGTGDHGNGQTSAATCTTGKDGGDGGNGADGAGATGIGSITAAGYTGASGGTGGTGTPGIGGGGGGGSKGTSAPISTACSISDPTNYYGASGGSGGSGGCGGKPGNVGGPGGSSIALVIVSAVSVKFDAVTLTPGKGGAGGQGGTGQSGGTQGAPGAGGDANDGGGLKLGCAGGAGGTGGAGGPGGGGQGGHSLGLAYKSTMLKELPTFPQGKPTPGAGGEAGAGAKDSKVGKGVGGNSTSPDSFMLEFK